MNIHINDKLLYYLPLLCDIEKMDKEKIKVLIKEIVAAGDEEKVVQTWRDKLEQDFDPMKALTVAVSFALKAKDDYSKVLRLIQQKKGVLYASEIVHCLYFCERNQFDDALKLLRGLPLTVSKLPVITKLKADILFDQGDYQEALRAYKDVIGKVPNESLVHSRIGEIFLRHKDIRTARGHFQKSIEMDPKNMMAHLYLGDIFKAEGDHAGAKREYGICAAIDFQSQVSKLAQQKLLILCREDRPGETKPPG
jgi:tetratricopeptide (TPR) repeat protein